MTPSRLDGRVASADQARIDEIEGLARDGGGAAVPGILARLESSSCTQDTDCCPGGEGCHFRCSYVPVESGGGTEVAQRCTLVDYAWCTHRFVDRSAQQGGGVVYLDRCNGFEGPDGAA